jgi:hypothetical protein
MGVLIIKTTVFCIHKLLKWLKFKSVSIKAYELLGRLPYYFVLLYMLQVSSSGQQTRPVQSWVQSQIQSDDQSIT